MQNLGTLPGGSGSSANGINDLGQVIGISNVPGQSAPQGFIWSAGSGMVQLASGLSVEPKVISGSGSIAGSASADGFAQSQFGFISVPGSSGITRVTVAGEATYGVEAMDEKGDMVVFGPQSSTSLFVAPGQDAIEISGGSLTEATAMAISASGVVVGSASSSPNGDAHAFMWSESAGMVDLTPIPGGDAFAQAINGNGDVVGYEILGTGDTFSFLYREGTMYDLTSLLGNSVAGWSALAPEGINDSGQIVGSGFFNGQVEAFIMSPSASPSAAAPEPASLAILALGATALLRRRRRV